MTSPSRTATTLAATFAIVLAAFFAPGLRAEDYSFLAFVGTDGGAGANDAAGSEARFGLTNGIAIDPVGNLYVADGAGTIRKLTPAGEVTTLAGIAGSVGHVDGNGSAARFRSPSGVTVDSDGNLFVADAGDQTIRRITPSGSVSTIAGASEIEGSADGLRSGARFSDPAGVAVDDSGFLYVTDTSNYTIRMISPEGVVTTLAGKSGSRGTQDGTGSAARFAEPWGIAFDSTSGNLYVSDTNTIRKVTRAGVVTTLGGVPGVAGIRDGPLSSALFALPRGLAVDGNGVLYVADADGQTIRKVTPAGQVTTIAGTPFYYGTSDGVGSAARFGRPHGIAVDSSGNAFVADTYTYLIRKVTPGGVVTTLAGKPVQSGDADGAGTAARFARPSGVALDSHGNLLVADSGNCTIRKVTPGGVVSTFAGSPHVCESADGAGSGARFNWPASIAIDAGDNAYVADNANSTIRKVSPAGYVSTLAGLAGATGSVDGRGSAARFHGPDGVAVDSGGNVYVADLGNYTIRKITPAGVVTTLAGLAGVRGYADGNGSAARFDYPRAIAVDSSGTVYVADTHLRKITPAGDVSTLPNAFAMQGVAVGPGDVLYASLMSTIVRIASNGDVVTLGGDGPWAGTTEGTGSAASFYFPGELTVSPAGDLYVVAPEFSRVYRGGPALPGRITIADVSDASGIAYQLGFSGAASSFAWQITRRPVGSSSLLSSEAASSPSFRPDVADGFQFQLVASDGVSSYIERKMLTPPRIVGSATAAVERTSQQVATITLTQPLDFTVTADWKTEGGNAVEGLDYVAASGSLTFAPGETSKTIPVQILDDGSDEDDEKFVVALSNVTGVQYGGPATITILDDDATPALSIDDVSVVEGDSGYASALFTVTLARPSDRTVSCSLAITGVTATAGSDFPVYSWYPLNFLAGETSKSAKVDVLGDTEGEADETFLVTLRVPADGVLADAQGVGTIINDDIVVSNPPQALTARATSTSSVTITWNPVGGASAYRLYRRSSGTDFVQIGLPVAPAWVDSGLTAGKSYLYKVRAIDPSVESVDSAPDLATTIVFTDPTITPGVTMPKPAHLMELRSAANAVRQLAGQMISPFTDSTLANGGTIRAVHLTELRTAIDAARVALGLPAMSYTDTAIQPGVTPLKAAHVTELRDAVR